MYNFLRIFILVFFIVSVFTPALFADDMYHSGYLDDVEKERYLKVVEFELPPEEQKLTIDLSRLIFTKEFSKDMLSRYHRKFGYTESQITFEAPNRYQEFTSYDGIRVTLEEDVIRKKRFGEYMLRKLTEYHVDKYLESNNNTKTIYKIKKQLSNATVGVGGGFKLRAKYSLSGKELKLRLKNSYGINNELIIDFENDLDFSGINYIYHIGIPIFWKMRFDNYYDTSKEDLTTVLRKYISKKLIFSLTNVYSFDDNNEENRIIFGVDWKF